MRFSHLLPSLLCLALIAGNPLSAIGQPALEDRVAPLLEGYDMKTQDFTAQSNQQDYIIRLAIPRQQAPATGWPVLYFLDGNAVLQDLQPDVLQQLVQEPAAMVFISHAKPGRFDVVTRSYDYTPPYPGEAESVDQLSPDRPNGGADLFLQFIRDEVQPWVFGQAPVNKERQAFWGHSYGGLLVLYALYTQPDLFRTYISVDPSLWWRDAWILEREKTFSYQGDPRQLLLMRGGVRHNTPLQPNVTAEQLAARRAIQQLLPDEATEQLAERLAKQSSLQVGYAEFANLTHGGMLPASLQPALQLTGSGQLPENWQLP